MDEMDFEVDHTSDELDLDDGPSWEAEAQFAVTPRAIPPPDEDDVARVAEVLGRTGGAANHPDGPGVGGD